MGSLCGEGDRGHPEGRAALPTEAEGWCGQGSLGRPSNGPAGAAGSDTLESANDGSGDWAVPGDGWRIWKNHGLTPHLARSFKVSNDPSSPTSSRTSSGCI